MTAIHIFIKAPVLALPTFTASHFFTLWVTAIALPRHEDTHDWAACFTHRIYYAPGWRDAGLFKGPPS